MKFVYCVLLVNGILAALVNCQGEDGDEGDEGDEGDDEDDGFYGNNDGQIIVYYSTGGIIVLALLVILVICLYYWYQNHTCCAGRPLRSNRMFVTLGIGARQKIENEKIFRSGFWTTQYCQDNNWHGTHRLSLLFDQKKLKVTGSGSDDIGIFNCYGRYSRKLGRMGLTKVYRPNTGDPSKNLGHAVIIQLTWNASDDQFEGKWYVRTSKYRGEGNFKLKFDEININYFWKV